MSYSKFCPKDIIAVNVFLERFQTRTHVGILKKEKDQFIFSYDEPYLKMKNILSLGPEFPLTQIDFYSNDLFPSFLDRLPDPNNPSYIDYCTRSGIAITTTDPLVRLASFKRGPSSFIFGPVYNNRSSFKSIENLRYELGLTLHDFACLFDISLSSLQKIKAGKTSGKEVLRLIELYLRCPEEFDDQVQRKIEYFHPNKAKTILELLNKMLNKERATKINRINRWHINSYHDCYFTQKCLQHLQSTPWANNLIHKISDQGLTVESMPLRFEIRFGYALFQYARDKIGFVIENEHQCSAKNSEIKDSDVDFFVEGEQTKWFIELTSLNESDEVKENTIVDGPHFSYTDRNMDSYKNERRAQSNIFAKVAKKDKKNEKIATPTKFIRREQPGEYNVIIIDMRGFRIGPIDENDYAVIVNGENQIIKDGEGNIIEKKQGDPFLRSIFDPEHPDPRAKYLQERIHAIGFIRETNYVDGEIERELYLYPNLKLLEKSNLKKDDLKSKFPLNIK